MAVKTDIEIAREAKKKPIMEIGAKLGIPSDHLLPYGHDKAKVGQEFIKSLAGKPRWQADPCHRDQPHPGGRRQDDHDRGSGRRPEPHRQEGGDLHPRGVLGPNFGMKGGAAGGGYAQVVPMEEMNLHFTGDFHAITSAHNLLSAMIDNHIYWGNSLDIDERRIVWRRVMDMNDRALRDIVVSLGGVSNGFPRQTGFDITVASEVMAILCLSNDLDDLQKRLGDIVVAYTRDKKPIYAATSRPMAR
jgi:formate--tetrahydrofolate ligase